MIQGKNARKIALAKTNGIKLRDEVLGDAEGAKLICRDKRPSWRRVEVELV